MVSKTTCRGFKSFCPCHLTEGFCHAAMAQSVERVLGKDEVTSSNLVSSSKSTCFCKCFFCVCKTALTFDKKEAENGSRPYKMAETARTPQDTFLLPPQKSSLSGAFFFSSLYFLFPLYFAFLALIFFSTASTSHTARNAHSVPIIAPPSTSVG